MESRSQTKYLVKEQPPQKSGDWRICGELNIYPPQTSRRIAANRKRHPSQHQQDSTVRGPEMVMSRVKERPPMINNQDDNGCKHFSLLNALNQVRAAIAKQRGHRPAQATPEQAGRKHPLSYNLWGWRVVGGRAKHPPREKISCAERVC